jgi:hypothetical protein
MPSDRKAKQKDAKVLLPLATITHTTINNAAHVRSMRPLIMHCRKEVQCGQNPRLAARQQQQQQLKQPARQVTQQV